MNIYYINKESSLKGPFDITNEHHLKIMRIGDICIKESEVGLCVLLIISETNKWKACKCIGTSIGSLGFEGNTLLFSFDGIERRHGNVLVFQKLYELFQEEPIHSFFQNAIDILLFRNDQWNIGLFSKIYLLPAIEIPTQSKGKDVSDNTLITIFETYLTNSSQELFRQLYSTNKTLREIYQELRNKYPVDFRESLKAFLRAHPNSTIYEKPSDAKELRTENK